MEWSLKMKTPFGVFALFCDDFSVIQTAYLPRRQGERAPQNPLASEAARQVRAYLRRARGFVFDLPLVAAPSTHQRKTRAAMLEVAAGDTRTYGDIARRIQSSPRAVGGACRANPLPLLVPCHRIVAADGLGGFGGDSEKQSALKTALLRHEAA